MKTAIKTAVKAIGKKPVKAIGKKQTETLPKAPAPSYAGPNPSPPGGVTWARPPTVKPRGASRFVARATKSERPLFDIGDDDGKTPSSIDKAQRKLVQADGVVSNLAAAAGGVDLAVNKTPLRRVAPALLARSSPAVTKTLGKATGVLQSAVWAADAGRAAADKTYRERKISEQAARMKSGDFWGSVGTAVQHPATGLAGGVKANLDARLDVKKQEGELAVARAGIAASKRKREAKRRNFKALNNRDETPEDRRYRAKTSKMFDEPIFAELGKYKKS